MWTMGSKVDRWARGLGACGLAVIALTTGRSPLRAQTKGSEKPPSNLRVLPEGSTRREVIAVMKGWTADLGVSCDHCHVGGDSVPFSEWDFSDDARSTKRVAREMVKLLEAVNRGLAPVASIRADGSTAPVATCATCHHGVPQPRPIEQVLIDSRASKGVTQAVSTYRDLRARYLASGSYDFTEDPLVRQARRFLGAKDLEGAKALLELARDLGFESLIARVTSAEVALAAGEPAVARDHLQKALGLAKSPEEKGFVEQRIRELEKNSPPAKPT